MLHVLNLIESTQGLNLWLIFILNYLAKWIQQPQAHAQS